MQGELSKKMTDAQVAEAARLFSVLSEPSRLRILRALMGGPLNVTEIMDATDLRQGNVSKHLGLLLDAGLVTRERDGNFVRYAIADPMLHDLCELVCCRTERQARERLEALAG